MASLSFCAARTPPRPLYWHWTSRDVDTWGRKRQKKGLAAAAALGMADSGCGAIDPTCDRSNVLGQRCGCATRDKGGSDEHTRCAGRNEGAVVALSCVVCDCSEETMRKLARQACSEEEDKGRLGLELWLLLTITSTHRPALLTSGWEGDEWTKVSDAGARDDDQGQPTPNGWTQVVWVCVLGVPHLPRGFLACSALSCRCLSFSPLRRSSPLLAGQRVSRVPLVCSLSACLKPPGRRY